ncbi:acyltransferase [Microcystis elabens FACHB-917]|nr:acyltransferase [Microcystis elabens FACHB-917]
MIAAVTSTGAAGAAIGPASGASGPSTGSGGKASGFAYRPDIDALRGAAMLAVLVFHLNKSWLPGGFTGVDIFFVISGYVVT